MLFRSNLAENNNLLQISTLGRFVVKRGETTLSDKANRSYRLWELFKYLLTNRNRSFLPETITENLWPDNNYSHSRQVVRTQVCRLRQLLNDDNSDSESVVFVQGCYQWDNKLDFWLDAEEFERFYRLARAKQVENHLQAVEYYRTAIGMYQGEYLPECSFNEWVIPVRNYYRNIFLQCVLDFTMLLQKHNRHAEIVDICEKAVIIEPYEEELHLRLMEALLVEGKAKKARIHYEYITSLLYREFGVKPSHEMRRIYRLIQNKSAVVDMDLQYVQDELTGKKEDDGAFLCDPDVFRSIYKLERRRSERTGQAVFLGMITLAGLDSRSLPRDVQDKAMADLLELLVLTLRKGDVVTKWNDSQAVVILPGADVEQARKVLTRVEKLFKGSDGILIHKKMLPVLPAL